MRDALPDVLRELEADALPPAAEALVSIATDYLAETRSGDGPVSTPLTPRELADLFEEPLPRRGRPLAEVAERLRREVVPASNRLCHPRSMGHQVSAPLPAAIWTEPLAAALNQSLAVLEMSPAGTAIEGRVVRWMCDLAGFGPAAGGAFTSGGTEADNLGVIGAVNLDRLRPSAAAPKPALHQVLGLDADQRARWEAAERPFLQQFDAATAQLENHRAALIDALFADTIDGARIESERAAIAELIAAAKSHVQSDCPCPTCERTRAAIAACEGRS